MRVAVYSLVAALCLSSLAIMASAEANPFSTDLSFGSAGASVMELQRVLNQDPDTRIASAGTGSPGNETLYFGSLTKAAVIRFQEKYANEILSPAGLVQGNGRVGPYTRAKLNTLSSPASLPPAVKQPSSIQSSTSTPPVGYKVTDTEKIDIYAGDKMVTNIRNRILSSLNAAIDSAAAAHNTATITPALASPADLPSVVLGDLAPQSGTPGTRVSITGSGVSTESTVYFGNTYIVRTVNKDLAGNFSFAVPPIPPGRYDVAIRSGNGISNTEAFVITKPGGPVVRLQEITPASPAFGDTLTVTGSGFHPLHNDVVTTYGTFTDVPSADGKTLSFIFAPERLRGVARVGDKSRTIPMFLYVVNDFGFSNVRKSFTMKL